MLLDDVARGFLLALVSAAHCAGMCGAFALHAAGAHTGLSSGSGAFAAYLGGKSLTYGFLGALAGAAGASLAAMGPAVRPILSGLVGIWLLGSAIGLLFGRRGIPGVSGRITRLLAPALRFVPRGPDTLSRFALGAATGALPCGVTSLALLDGAATGSALRSAVVLLGLGVGTMPALAAVGFLGTHLSGPLRRPTWRSLAAAGLLALAAWNLRITFAWLFLEPAVGNRTCCH